MPEEGLDKKRIDENGIHQKESKAIKNEKEQISAA